MFSIIDETLDEKSIYKSKNKKKEDKINVTNQNKFLVHASALNAIHLVLKGREIKSCLVLSYV